MTPDFSSWRRLLIDLRSSYRNTNCVIRPSGTRKGRTYLSRSVRRAKDACVCVPLSFRNGSGSAFSPVDRAISIKPATWIDHLYSRTTNTQYTGDRTHRGRTIARLTYLNIDWRGLLFRLVPVATRVIHPRSPRKRFNYIRGRWNIYWDAL